MNWVRLKLASSCWHWNPTNFLKKKNNLKPSKIMHKLERKVFIKIEVA